MSASTVTGKGGGAALGSKGPGNLRDQFVPLASPHVLAAGVTTLSGANPGVAAVNLPAALSVIGNNTAVIATVDATSGTGTVTAHKTETTTGLKTFTLYGTTSATVQWMVVNLGMGMEAIQPTDPRSADATIAQYAH